jgi:ATP-binding cassette, subfamily B, bacterial
MTRLLRPYGGLLVAYLKPQRGRALLLATLLVASIALQLASPQVVRHFIDIAQHGGPLPELTRTAALFIGVVLGGQLLAAVVLYLGADVGWVATNLLRADLLAHVLRLDLRFHNARTPGELIQRVDGDVDALSNFFSQFVGRVLGSMLLVCGIVLLLLWEDWRLGLAICIIAALGLALLSRLQGVAVPLVKAHRQGFAELTGFWEERLLGTEDIRALGAQPYIMRRHFDLLEAHMRKARLGNAALRIMQSAGELLLAAGTAATFSLSAYLLYGGAITIGTVYLVFAYTDLLAWNVLAIATQLDDLQQASAGIERIRELRAATSALPDTGRMELPPGAPALAFEQVSFGYNDGGTKIEDRGWKIEDRDLPSSILDLRSSLAGDLVLQNISFQLEAGHVLGLLGRTGSGKTTLTRLLFRFYDPQHGAIRLDGIDIKGLSMRALRQRIGMVTQEVQLFHASVRDNLTLFNPQLSDARILETIAELGLGPWLRALPAGLDTELAPGGGGLSAGEAQLLAFTRVFLRDPAVVVLDEASSRLDPATEQLIGRATERLIQGRTAIIIAHRLATVERVDEILILEDGRIIEHGHRAALRADPASRFAQLLRTGLTEVLA